MLLECYVYDKQSLEAFSGHFYYSSRDRYTGEKTETSLKDQIKFTTDSGTPANQRNFYKKLLHQFNCLKNSLKNLASKVVFDEYLNSILVFHSDGDYFCSCNEFSGCQNYIGYEGYCYVCRFCDHYSASDVEKIKYEPTNLINFALELFNDIKLCLEFTGGINLKDCHYFQFARKFAQNSNHS